MQLEKRNKMTEPQPALLSRPFPLSSLPRGVVDIIDWGGGGVVGLNKVVGTTNEYLLPD
jgi:hypothetical protein